MMRFNHYLPFVITILLSAVDNGRIVFVFGQPSPLPTPDPSPPPEPMYECNPCTLVQDGEALLQACKDLNLPVLEIVERDIMCGRNWDAFCVVVYNDCYDKACGLAEQDYIDSIAEIGGPLGGPINRTEVVENCAT